MKQKVLNHILIKHGDDVFSLCDKHGENIVTASEAVNPEKLPLMRQLWTEAKETNGEEIE